MNDASKNPGDLNARQLGILVRMLNAADQKTRDVAARAMKNLDPEKVSVLLQDRVLSEDVLVFFARHASGRKDWVESLLSNPSLPEEGRAALLNQVPEHSPLKEETAEDGKELNISQRIARMTVGEKIKFAMKGDKEARTILIKDPNREVFMSVLGNPGIKENEVEMIAKNTGTNADILRAIARNREWVSNRNIMLSLVMNPKTPVEISVRFLPRLMKRDLEFIVKSRALPMAVRTNARRLVLAKAKGR